MLLEVAGLKKNFGLITVADDLDLRVGSGEAVGIIGPNGAGKTTLFNLIAGGLSPTAGSIRFDGNDLLGLPPQRRCRAGLGRTHQIPQPFEKLTVLENLLVGAVYGSRRTEREAAQSCGEILEQLGLLRRANVLAGSLTLLERKRLEMARALATAPKLLLLDEIAGGLTEGECAELVVTIHDIRKTGVSILWIEHVVHALFAVIDRLVVLNFGRKIADGAPKEVMQRPDVHQIYIGIEA
ncbi:branched-chain amino acid transport system ATP-binding protein [Bradyrhizobium elkanii]|uniref:ABC transporter ATP-binding protein n=1 Tax=Bradyrhizobium TaxID=374 RepID=UPI00216A45BA|nr:MULTISPECIES: ABC transporter ATP-binding protein [Bradyrhizobium]MCS3932072.1 branched-chain amino acid transport system ATP-binding protein [Bradyrhizobium elkanii]MCS3972630.1 branched-chain amino acid transport system ATP-binding protein [Bradyrhizobium japonicum]